MRQSVLFGGMGAQMQPQWQLQMSVLGFDQNVQTASDAPRWRIEPDGVLWLEQGFLARTVQSLIDMGHGVKHDVPLD